MSEHKCGPQYAKSFFDSVSAAIAANGATREYYISCVDHETDIIGVDFESSVGITTPLSDSLETNFVPKGEVNLSSGFVPYKWLGSKPISFLESTFAKNIDFGGPERHKELFEAFEEIGHKHPKDAQKYALVSRAYYTKALGLTGDDDVAEGSIRDGKVYHRVAPEERRGSNCECCTWDDETGDCNGSWCDD